jgi:mannosyl-oligosaccharide alpha-1,2-mannosidase
MWRITGDPKWRDRAYEIYRAIERHTRTELGYASVNNVDSITGGQMDEMPRYALGFRFSAAFLLHSWDAADGGTAQFLPRGDAEVSVSYFR